VVGRNLLVPVSIPYSGSIGGEVVTAGESAANPARLGAMNFPLDPVNRFVAATVVINLSVTSRTRS
jgi:hypothetical protein